MGNRELRAIATGDDEPKKGTFPSMLKMYQSQIAAALPRHIKADRMARIALTCYRLNPKLADCKPASVFAAVIQSAQLGLEPGLNGRAFLVPYGDECQFVPGWKGLVELANRSGRASVWTGAVVEGDKLDYMLGDSPFIRHLPNSDDDQGKLTHVYAVGRPRGADWPIIEVWSDAKIKKHFNRYNKIGKKHYAHANWEMYARKIPLLQVLKYLPSSPELDTALALDAAADAGEQGLTIKDAIEGTFTAPPSTDNGNGAPTYGEIVDAIAAATDKDGVDAARTLIHDGLPEGQRDELTALASQRYADLDDAR